MTISFKYKKLPGKKGREIKTPSIPVTLSGNNATPIEVIALLDSGADLSVIPQGLAEFLNLDLDGKRGESHGIGGKIPIVESNLWVVLKKGHENYRFNIPVQVVIGPDQVPPLLGRTGFFDQFVISFDNKEEKVTLKKKTRKGF